MLLSCELWVVKLWIGVGWKLSSWRLAYKIGGANLQVQVVEIEEASFEVRLQTLRLYLQVLKDCQGVNIFVILVINSSFQKLKIQIKLEI